MPPIIDEIVQNIAFTEKGGSKVISTDKAIAASIKAIGDAYMKAEIQASKFQATQSRMAARQTGTFFEQLSGKETVDRYNQEQAFAETAINGIKPSIDLTTDSMSDLVNMTKAVIVQLQKLQDEKKASLGSIAQSFPDFEQPAVAQAAVKNPLTKRQIVEATAPPNARIFGTYNQYIGQESAIASEKAKKALSGFDKSLLDTNKSLNTLRWSMVNIGFVAGTLAAAFSPFVLLTNYGMELETVFTRISIVTGQTVSKISSSLQNLRKGTMFSLQDTASAFLEFTKAGFSADQALTALPSAIRLSQVGFTDLSTAVRLTAQVLHQFNLDATEAEHVAKTLAAGANLSATDVEGFGTALTYVGPIAEQLGIQMEETAAAIAILSNSGQGASKAGTTLGAALTKMIEPGAEAEKKLKSLGVTLFDTEGEFLGIDNAVKQLSASLYGMSSEDKLKNLTDIFGRIGGRAVMSLMSQYTQSGIAVSDMQKDIAASAALAASAMKIQQTTAAQLATAWADLGASLAPVSNLLSIGVARVLQELSGSINIVSGIFRSFYDMINGSTEPFTQLNRNFNGAEGAIAGFLAILNLIPGMFLVAEPLYYLLSLFGLTEGIDNAAIAFKNYGKTAKELGTEVTTLAEIEEKERNIRKAAWNSSILSVVTNYTGALSDLIVITTKFGEDAANKFDKAFSGVGTELSTIAKRFKEQANTSGVADSIMSIVDAINAASTEYAGLDSKLKAFNDSLDAEKKSLDANNILLKEQESILSGYKEKLATVEEAISKLSKKRFVGQTDVDKLISKVETWQKKQKLATYGITDAFSFLQSAVRMTESEYENFFKTIVKTNEATQSGKNDYEAWRETVKTFIVETIKSGNDLKTSVTSTVSKYQSLLEQTSKFDDSTSDTSESVALLQDAYDVHYGAMEDDVKYAIQAHEDQTNGVASSSVEIIAALNRNWIAQNFWDLKIKDTSADIVVLKDKVNFAETAINGIKTSIDLTTDSMLDLVNMTKAAIVQLQKLQKLDKPYEKTWEGGGMSIAQPSFKEEKSSRDYSSHETTWEGGGMSVAPTDQYMTPYTPEQYMTPYTPTTDTTQFQSMLSDTIAAQETVTSNVFGTIDNAFENISSMFSSIGGLFGFGDFVMRPGQEPVKFSPDDTLIGTKGGMGGGGVNIQNITISGVEGNAEDFAYAFAQELRRQIRAV